MSVAAHTRADLGSGRGNGGRRGVHGRRLQAGVLGLALRLAASHQLHLHPCTASGHDHVYGRPRLICATGLVPPKPVHHSR